MAYEIKAGLLKSRLGKLKKYMPNESKTVYALGTCLADRMDGVPGITGEEFYRMGRDALMEFNLGHAYFSSLDGLTPVGYAVLCSRIPDIANAVAKDSPDFLEGVRAAARKTFVSR